MQDDCKPSRENHHTAWYSSIERMEDSIERLENFVERITGSDAHTTKEKPPTCIVSLSEFLAMDGKPIDELADRVDHTIMKLEELLF